MLFSCYTLEQEWVHWMFITRDRTGKLASDTCRTNFQWYECECGCERGVLISGFTSWIAVVDMPISGPNAMDHFSKVQHPFQLWGPSTGTAGLLPPIIALYLCYRACVLMLYSRVQLVTEPSRSTSNFNSMNAILQDTYEGNDDDDLSNDATSCENFYDAQAEAAGHPDVRIDMEPSVRLLEALETLREVISENTHAQNRHRRRGRSTGNTTYSGKESANTIKDDRLKIRKEKVSGFSYFFLSEKLSEIWYLIKIVDTIDRQQINVARNKYKTARSFSIYWCRLTLLSLKMEIHTWKDGLYIETEPFLSYRLDISHCARNTVAQSLTAAPFATFQTIWLQIYKFLAKGISFDMSLMWYSEWYPKIHRPLVVLQLLCICNTNLNSDFCGCVALTGKTESQSTHGEVIRVWSPLTHWGRDKMDAISQTPFSNAS